MRTDRSFPTRVLAVGLDASTVRRWLGEGASVETAPDLLQAVGQLWDQSWDVVVAGMGKAIEHDLPAWLDALDHTEKHPLVIAVTGESLSYGDSNRPLTLAEVEARHITEVLQQTGGRITEAARVLGVHRNTLARKVKTIVGKSGRPIPSNETIVPATT